MEFDAGASKSSRGCQGEDMLWKIVEEDMIQKFVAEDMLRNLLEKLC